MPSIDPTTSTADAALAAREGVERAARGASHDERGAAALARAALFDEALLGALKARFAELKSVAR
ncbi:MAG TPA: hypothetical protein VE591_12600 [Candidatus Acidoferrum sp.]|nr:hypothetical protein [Candidatus Acidoferrum sp.]